MQFCSILVALAGDMLNQVPKDGVSVPEVLVLMAGHGRDSVTIVEGSVFEERGSNPVEEVARLRTAYGDESVTAVFGKASFNVNLPTRFSEAGIDVPDADDLKDGNDDGKAETAREKKARLKAEAAMKELAEAAKAPADSAPETPPVTTPAADKDEVPSLQL